MKVDETYFSGMESFEGPLVEIRDGCHAAFAQCTFNAKHPGPALRIGPGCAVFLMQGIGTLDLYTGEQVAELRARIAALESTLKGTP